MTVHREGNCFEAFIPGSDHRNDQRGGYGWAGAPRQHAPKKDAVDVILRFPAI